MKKLSFLLLIFSGFLSAQTPIPGPATSAPRTDLQATTVPGTVVTSPPGTATVVSPSIVPGPGTVVTPAPGIPAAPKVPGPGTVVTPGPGATPATTPESPKLKYEQVLDNWFGALPGPDSYPAEKSSAWFAKTPENQMRMINLFETDLNNAVSGQYNDWRMTPRGRLALIILLDQVPRLIYQDKPQAFTADRMALGLAIEGMQKGDDLRLYPIERAFYYMPLMHSEDPNMQTLSIAKYNQLVAETPAQIQPQIEQFLTFALIHQNVIKKFGRFPYMNIINGRQSTPEELEYLRNWGYYPN